MTSQIKFDYFFLLDEKGTRLLGNYAHHTYIEAAFNVET